MPLIFRNRLDGLVGGAAGAFSDDTLVWPGSSNTGYLNHPSYAGSLTAGPGTVAASTTYSQRSWTSSIPDIANLSNITFEGCLFQGYNPDVWLMHITGSSDNITFRYCTFRPDASAASYRTYASGQCYQYGIHADNSTPHQLTVENCEFWGFGNAFQINGSSQTKPHTFKHNWFHHAADNNGTFNGDTGVYHHDGILNTVGGAAYSYVVIDHNTFESLGNTNAIALQLDGGTGYNHVTATRNLLTGWGYAVAIGNASSSNANNTFVDNVWSTKIQPLFGPLYGWTGTNRTWRRNRWKVPSGAMYGNVADDGKYWDTTGSPSSSDTVEGTTFPYYCTAIRATPGVTNASVEFTAPTDNGGASVTGYRVTAWQGGVITAITATGSSSPITITGLTSGVAYTFTVAATNSVGYGFESNPCGVVTIL